MLNLSNVVTQLQAQRSRSNPSLVDWTQQSMRFGEQTPETARGQFEFLLPDHAAAPCPPQAAGRLVLHRKHAGRSEL